jgi:hypothetical protein
VEILGVLVFIFLFATIEKHNIYGLRKFFSDEYKTEEKKTDMPVEEFDEALKQFNESEKFDFKHTSSTKKGQARSRVKEIYEDSKSDRFFHRIRDTEKEEIVTVFAPDEKYEELPDRRPKKGFWGNRIPKEGNDIFKSRDEYVDTSSKMSRWKTKYERKYGKDYEEDLDE